MIKLPLCVFSSSLTDIMIIVLVTYKIKLSNSTQLNKLFYSSVEKKAKCDHIVQNKGNTILIRKKCDPVTTIRRRDVIKQGHTVTNKGRIVNMQARAKCLKGEVLLIRFKQNPKWPIALQNVFE